MLELWDEMEQKLNKRTSSASNAAHKLQMLHVSYEDNFYKSRGIYVITLLFKSY